MAKAKAKAKTKRSAKSDGKFSTASLPTGYKAIERGGFAPSWDFRHEPKLEGVIGAVRTVDQGKGKSARKVRVMEIGGRTVWESKALEAMFELKKGTKVCIVFRGFIPIPGRSLPMKDFQIGTR